MSERRTRPLPAKQRLVAHKMAIMAVPPNGGIGDGIEFLMDRDRISKTAKEAMDWVDEAIRVVKSAPDNPYGDDDNAICEAILLRVDQKRGRG